MAFTPKFTLDLQSASTQRIQQGAGGFRDVAAEQNRSANSISPTAGRRSPGDCRSHASAQSGRRQPASDSADHQVLRPPDGQQRMEKDRAGDPVRYRRQAARCRSPAVGFLSVGSFVPNLRHRRRSCRSDCSPTSTTARRARQRMLGDGRPQRPVQAARSVVTIAMHYEQGCYTASTKKTLERVTPDRSRSTTSQEHEQPAAWRAADGW